MNGGHVELLSKSMYECQDSTFLED